MAKDVEVRIKGDASGVKKAFSETEAAGESAESKLSRIGSSINTMGDKITSFGKSTMRVGATMSAAVTLPIIGLGKVFADELGDAQKKAAQTEAVIKSTGGAAGITAEHVSNLAGSLSELSGVDDEVIAGGQNMLLTFTNVKNEVGEGKDIFDQATKVALDMSVAMGEDISSSAMRLGKALNDPIAGASALRKVGVQLTDQQEEQIKSFMAVGDTASAQKVIIEELNKEFGGSAEAAGETMPGKLAKLQNKFMEMGASILEKLLPHLEKLFGWIEKGVDWFTNLDGSTQGIIAAVLGLAAVLGPIITILGAVATAIGFVLSPVGLVIAAIAALAAGIWWLWNNNETFRAGIMAVWQWIQNTVIPIAQEVGAFVITKWGELFAWLQEMWPKVQEAAEHVWNAIQAVISFVTGVISTIVDGWGDNIFNIVKTIWDGIYAAIEFAITLVRNIIEFVVNLINGDWGAAWENVKNIGRAAWDFIVGIVQRGIDIVRNLIGMIADTIRNIFSWVWDHIKGVFTGIWDTITGTFNNVVSFITGLPGMITNAVRGLWDGVVNGFKNALNSVISLWNNLSFTTPNIPGTDFGGITISTPDIPYLAKGGVARSGGLAVVGDAGPELLNLPRGARVDPLSGPLGAGAPILMLNVQGNVFTEQDLMQFVQDGLNRLYRQDPRALEFAA